LASRRASRNRPAIVVPSVIGAVICVLAACPPADGEAWEPPLPDPTQHDWVMLKSGEWLRGEIKSMRNEKLEFDSEELDLLELDWEDVKQIRSPRNLEYVFEGGLAATGPATMRDGLVKVRVGEDVLTFQAARTISIIEGAMSEWDHWSLKVSLGVVTLSGNTNQQDYSAVGLLRREARRTRFDTNYVGNIGWVGDVQSVDNHVLSSRVDAFLTTRLFVTPVSGEFYTDRFKNIDSRTTLAAGLGYDLFRGKLDWYFQLSVGYLRTEFVSVEEGESGSEESWTLIPNTLLEWEPNDVLDTSLRYSATVSIPKTENTFHSLLAMIELELTGALDLTFSVTWDRTQNPKPREDGSVPEPDDVRVSLGLGIDL
jgi:putative salt-induced outer membrane protein YdiY